MSGRGFAIYCAVWVVACWLATTPLGAMLGFFLGITVAFFGMPLLIISGIPAEALWPVWYGLVAVYVGVGLFFGGAGVWAAVGGRMRRAYGFWAGLVAMVGVVLIVQLSMAALAASWH